MNLEKIEWLANNALDHAVTFKSDKLEEHAYIIAHLQQALRNIKYYVEDEIKSNSK
jgi:hypothetical protein